jgi:two-component system, cell cycle sensor histidine kinase and response regulator CckA
MARAGGGADAQVTVMAVLRQRLQGLSPRLRRGLLWLLAAAAYMGSIRLSLGWTLMSSDLPLLWLPVGLGYGLVVCGGSWYAVPIAAGSLADGLVSGIAPWQNLGLAAVAAGSALTIAWLLHLGGVRASGEGLVDTTWRTLVGASAIGAWAGIVTAGFALGPGLGRNWQSFWALATISGLGGYFTVGPFVRTWLGGRSVLIAGRREQGAMLAAAAGASALAASGVLGHDVSVTYLIFPVVIWAAVRAGRRGISTVIVVVTLVATILARAGLGPFVESHTTSDVVVSLDGLLIVMSLTGLIVAGLEKERRANESTLRRSEERFRALIENASDVVTVIAEDGTILYESPSAFAVLGFRPDELEGRHVFTRLHPEDVERSRDSFERLLAGEDPVRVSLRHRHKDGSWREMVSTARNLLDDPAVGGIVANLRDVTESRRAERELAEAELRYRTLVERLPLVTYVNGPTPDEAPLYVSPQIEELLGYPVSAWYEDPRFAYKSIHPDDVEALDELFVEDAEDSVYAEYRMIADDGRVVWVLDHMVTVRDEQGAPVAVQGFLVDITERKRLEDQLLRAQRMEALGLLAGGVAHDFNNLLTAISGYGELARGRLGEPERARRDLDEVLHAAGRASDLTRQLLAFGRRQVVDQDVVDLNAVIEETWPLLARVLGESIELVCSCAPEAGAVRADAGQLEQVLVNLTVNAREAMPTGGRLTIATSNEVVTDPDGPTTPGEYVVLAVADTGVGMEDAVSERVFEPFFTTKDVGEGSGLGLAVVYGIVDQSGGSIAVRSRPGEGTEFRILLPRVEARAGARTPAPAQLPRGSETVLLVEDEEIVRRLTAEMLERQGYEVVTAASPVEALKIGSPYDLLLTDVVMPGMSGPQLAERLALERPGVAVLFTSGYSANAVADPADLAGDLLEKPFTLEQLASKVRQALDARAV